MVDNAAQSGFKQKARLIQTELCPEKRKAYWRVAGPREVNSRHGKQSRLSVDTEVATIDSHPPPIKAPEAERRAADTGISVSIDQPGLRFAWPGPAGRG